MLVFISDPATFGGSIATHQLLHHTVLGKLLRGCGNSGNQAGTEAAMKVWCDGVFKSTSTQYRSNRADLTDPAVVWLIESTGGELSHMQRMLLQARAMTYVRTHIGPHTVPSCGMPQSVVLRASQSGFQSALLCYEASRQSKCESARVYRQSIGTASAVLSAALQSLGMPHVFEHMHNLLRARIASGNTSPLTDAEAAAIPLECAWSMQCPNIQTGQRVSGSHPGSEVPEWTGQMELVLADCDLPEEHMFTRGPPAIIASMVKAKVADLPVRSITEILAVRLQGQWVNFRIPYDTDDEWRAAPSRFTRCSAVRFRQSGVYRTVT